MEDKDYEPIYTRAGDAGRTRSAGGEMVWKFSPVVHLLGELESLNVEVGAALEAIKRHHIRHAKESPMSDSNRRHAIEAAQMGGRSFTESDYSKDGFWVGTSQTSYSKEAYLYALIYELHRTQNKLFALDAEVSCYETNKAPVLRGPVCQEDIERLEYMIDAAMVTDVGDGPHLGRAPGPMLPRGPQGSIALHRARSQCRRAERAMAALFVEMIAPAELHLAYLNRLSDFLFTAARFYQVYLNVEEAAWVDQEDEELTARTCREYEGELGDLY